MSGSDTQLISKQELTERISQALSRSGKNVSAQIEEDFVDELVDEISRQSPAGARVVDKSLTEKNTYYAIHNDDFKLLDDSIEVAIGLFDLASLPLILLGKLVALLFRYRKKRAKLTGEQGVVLLALKKAPASGWTTDELGEKLKLDYKLALAVGKLEEILRSLKDVRLSDGTATDFAHDFRGRWSAVDV
jgi:hypothetical protein